MLYLLSFPTFQSYFEIEKERQLSLPDTDTYELSSVTEKGNKKHKTAKNSCMYPQLLQESTQSF